ncbi:MAG TPA: hypothetical protein VF432_17930 [Thermoanaerobaculia bacterium]
MSELPVAPSEYGQRAFALMIKVRELMNEIKGFRYSARGRRVKIGAASSLPEEFLQLMAVACDANAPFASRVQLTGPEIRDRLEFRREFLGLARETHLVAKGLEDTIAEELAEIGHRALKAYKTAQDMESGAEKESLIPHLEGMRRAINRGRRAKSKEEEDAAGAKKGEAK